MSPIGNSLTKLNTDAQLQTFPYPTASKSFLYSNAFMAKSGAQTLTFKRVTDKQTNRQTDKKTHKNFNFGGSTPLSCTDGGEIWHGGGDLQSPPPLAWRRGPLVPSSMPNFTPIRCNVSPLRGEKPQNRPLSKLNTGRFALRAMLPVMTWLHTGVTPGTIAITHWSHNDDLSHSTITTTHWSHNDNLSHGTMTWLHTGVTMTICHTVQLRLHTGVTMTICQMIQQQATRLHTGVTAHWVTLSFRLNQVLNSVLNQTSV